MPAHRLLPSVAFLVAVSSFFVPPVLGLAGMAPHREAPRQRLDVRPMAMQTAQLQGARCQAPAASTPTALPAAAPRRSVVAMAAEPIR